LQLAQGLAPGDQRSHPGGIAENLVEGQRDEIGMGLAQIETVGGRERRRVEQHVPAERLRPPDPGQIVLDAGEVRLGRVGEQVGRVGAGLAQQIGEPALVNA